MITLAPEDSEKTFKVPRALLITASSWFEKALDKRFREGQNGVLKLFDTNTETIENFLFWLYYRRNPFSKCPTVDKNTDDCDNEEAHRVAAINFWAFGDKHFIPRIQEVAMLTLVRSMDKDRKWPSLSVIKLGYTVSAAGSPLRSLLSEMSVAGLVARQNCPTKKRRRRHDRLTELPPPSTANLEGSAPEGYALEDFEQIEDTPGLLIDILKSFISRSSAEDQAAQRNILSKYLQRISAPIEGEY